VAFKIKFEETKFAEDREQQAESNK
jgi:hypothetical protein